MNRVRSVVSVSVLLACTALIAAEGNLSQASRSRSFQFEYLIRIPELPKGNHKLRVWVPIPHTTQHQQIAELKIESPVSYRIYREPEFGNRAVVFVFEATAVRALPAYIRMEFKTLRYEYKVKLPSTDPPAPSRPLPTEFEPYLRADRLIPTNGVIGELSRQQTIGISDPIEKVRKIYDYVIKTMHYDHSGTGWGRGDAVWACSSHHGNCTDFHSLFIGMVRASGIPAEFEIGFPIPSDQHQGKISGYHCWARFYIHGIGWIPVDASEAWQTPPKHNYFFGALDANRVAFTSGRDLTLNPKQKGSPINYFIYPYAELDGKTYNGLTYDFYFKDLHDGDRSAIRSFSAASVH